MFPLNVSRSVRSAPGEARVLQPLVRAEAVLRGAGGVAHAGHGVLLPAVRGDRVPAHGAAHGAAQDPDVHDRLCAHRLDLGVLGDVDFFHFERCGKY